MSSAMRLLPCICVGLAGFCDYFLLTMAIPIFPELNATGLPMGALFSAKPIFQLLSVPLVTHFLDGHEARLMRNGLLLEIVCLLCFGFSISYPTWFFFRAASGLASASILSGGFAYLGCYHDDPHERATAMGLAFAGVYAGVLAGPVLGGALFEAEHMLPFVVLAAVEALVLLAVCTFLPRTRSEGTVPEAPESCGSLLSHGAVSGPLIAVLVSTSYIAALETTTARYVMKTFDFDVAAAGEVWLYVTVPTVAAALLAGPLGWLIGKANLIGLGMLLGGVTAVLSTAAHSFAALVVALFSAGLCFGIVNGCASPLLGEVANTFFGGTGRVYALANSAEQLGFIVGPLLGSTLSEYWNSHMVRVTFGSLLLTCTPFVCCTVQPSEPTPAKFPTYGSAF